MNRKLLIVEDESEYIIILGPQAKRYGYECEIDMTGETCVEKALSFEPDAVLLDMNLPKISGLGLIHKIRNHEKLSKLPIVVLSAVNQPEVVKEAMDRGANAYFSKSGKMEDLFHTLDEYISDPNLAQKALHAF